MRLEPLTNDARKRIENYADEHGAKPPPIPSVGDEVVEPLSDDVRERIAACEETGESL